MTVVGRPAVAGTTVEMLRSIWGSVLQTSPIGDDDFFDLGGDSLIAISLFLEIARATGRNLPITTIYDAPTIESLALLLSQDNSPAPSTVVRISQGNSWPPIFLAHGVGGNVMDVPALAPHFRTEQLYALQARGLDGLQQPRDSVEQMAGDYLAAIKSIQPEGPYVLIGYSFGGLVALEIARQLTAAGEHVAMLAMADTYPHPRFWPVATWLPVMARLALFHARAIASQRSTGRLTYAMARACKLLTYVYPHPALFRIMDADKYRALPPSLARVRQAGYFAWSHYEPPAYDGKITYFAAEVAAPGWPSRPANVWKAFARKLELHRVAGNHDDMLTGHAADFAASFLPHMRKALGVQ